MNDIRTIKDLLRTTRRLHRRASHLDPADAELAQMSTIMDDVEQAIGVLTRLEDPAPARRRTKTPQRPRPDTPSSRQG
jgi:phosphomevalonate kinase